MNKTDAIICILVAVFLATMLYFRVPPFGDHYVLDFCKTENVGNPTGVEECLKSYEQSQHKG